MTEDDLERALCTALKQQPAEFDYKFTKDAHRDLLQLLFRSLTGYSDTYLRGLFSRGVPGNGELWSLKDSQGAVEGAEYTEAARGKACGHIFRINEATYSCRTCRMDPTCVLCSHCFEASDHEGHVYSVATHQGGTGCCDCGDPEAWRLPVNCAIHAASASLEKGKAASGLPEDLVQSIRTTVSRAYDYVCDVFSCSPEQLRLPKDERSIRADEVASRLTSPLYGGDLIEESPDFAIIIWNDEKHTVIDVVNQVVRACKEPSQFGYDRAYEADTIGRSILKHSKDVSKLLKMSAIIEQLKLTVTIRSSRDTFRECMCGVIIDWLLDIAGCSVGNDHDILRQTVCDELLRPWQRGSKAQNEAIGRRGLDDHENEENHTLKRGTSLNRNQRFVVTDIVGEVDLEDLEDLPVQAEDGDDEDGDEDEEYQANAEDEEAGDDEDEMEVDSDLLALVAAATAADQDTDMPNAAQPEDELEPGEATLAGYTPPPPPPAPPVNIPPVPETTLTFHEPPAESSISPGARRKSNIRVPETDSPLPGRPRVPEHWLQKPAQYYKADLRPEEDLWKQLRLDWLIIWDLRLWKQPRQSLRRLYINALLTIPHHKRILGLRFAGLYTQLAQLYLVSDREPDLSIINLSLQIFTTASISDEIIERGNFLTTLLAILYTFLTNRQVSSPEKIHPAAVLAIDVGSVTNRRLYHFFSDLMQLMQMEHVQDKIRDNDQYHRQFIDLFRLPQGICPNVRAVGEHLEYETDQWITISLVTREINRLCRQFGEAFKRQPGGDFTQVRKAIRYAASQAILNSLGTERKRFREAEIDGPTTFKILRLFKQGGPEYRVVNFTVEKGPMSFHHPLHYTLSWLIESAKNMSPGMLKETLAFTPRELYGLSLPSKPWLVSRTTNTEGWSGPEELQDLDSEDYLMAMFDFPIRVHAWLAQMRSNAWIRNGMSLRHQMSQYRIMVYRDLAYRRDTFLLQTALVVCNPSRVLASIIDRFGMEGWVRGNFSAKPGFEMGQWIDITEDFILLLISLLSDRSNLIPSADDENGKGFEVKRDIIHLLGSKPMSFSDLDTRLGDKFAYLEDYQEVLDEVADYKEPEGLSDTGLFTLKPEYLQHVDPYASHLTKNQRDETEHLYREHMAKVTGKPIADIVYEPALRPINSGPFQELTSVTSTSLFAGAIYQFLKYAVLTNAVTGSLPHDKGISASRLEALLNPVIHLILIATLEDRTEDNSSSGEPSFILHSLYTEVDPRKPTTILTALSEIYTIELFEAHKVKIRHIVRLMMQKRPRAYVHATRFAKLSFEDLAVPSPAVDVEAETALKRQQAKDRQARVMAQFQKQQQQFMANQGDIDWGEEDFSDPEEIEAPSKVWKYPIGESCILCQESTNDTRLCGTFGFIMESRFLRQTNLRDEAFVKEVVQTPLSLDASAESIRPFGVSGDNKKVLNKLNANGKQTVSERRVLGRGFPPEYAKTGPVSVGCGHVMHWTCFENYYSSTQRRQAHQIARQHPERLREKEFNCPLCKALGNTFFPLVWKAKEEASPELLKPEMAFMDWTTSGVAVAISRTQKQIGGRKLNRPNSRHQDMMTDYISRAMNPTLAGKLDSLMVPKPTPSSTTNQQQQTSRILPLLSAIPGLHSFGATRDSGSSTETAIVGEVFAAYKRIRDTIRANSLETQYTHPSIDVLSPDDLLHVDTLTKTLACSITAVETAQRGIASELGMTLIDKVPQQALTHLRILSETVSSYIAIGGVRQMPGNKTMEEFLDLAYQQLYQLFRGHPELAVDQFSAEFMDGQTVVPLVQQDIFTFFSEACVCLVPTFNLDVHHVMELCYVAEIVKVVFTVLLHLPKGLFASLEGVGPHQVLINEYDDADDAQLSNLRYLMTWVQSHFVFGSTASASHLLMPPSDGVVKYVRKLVRTYALSFLRKSAILLHTRFGVDFPFDESDTLHAPELDRLARRLSLPSVDEVLASHFDGSGLDFERICASWLLHYEILSRRKESVAVDLDVSLSHPVIFELIGLPQDFDTLTAEAMRRKCPTTGKELSDPCICLFCGDIFCSQSVCCMKDRKGGMNQHMAKYVLRLLYVEVILTFTQMRQECWYLPQHPQMRVRFSIP